MHHHSIRGGNDVRIDLVKEVEDLFVRLGLLEKLRPVLFFAFLLSLRLQRIDCLYKFESFQSFASLKARRN